MADQNSISKFEYKVNGVAIEQRATDGFINATAMCKAHGKDASDWLRTDPTLELVSALARRLGIEPKTAQTPKSIKTRVAAFFPSLVITKAGSPETGGGTWIHPKLAVHLGQWCSPDFALQVSDWIENWILTGQNPIYQTREQIILTLVPEKPKKWEKRYGEDFWKHLERLTTYRQGNIQCAFFINEHIYDYFPRDVRIRLEEVNPLTYGRRPHKQHQHFDGELLTGLQFHILAVLTIMEASSCHKDFLQGMQAKFQGIYALKLPNF